MKFYHRTKLETWKKIQKEEILFGVHENYRYTYLSPCKDIHKSFGSILLEVEYTPMGVGELDSNGEPYDNYGFYPPKGMICWQFSVFKPIPLKKVRRFKRSKSKYVFGK